MKTIINIPDDMTRTLANICKQQNISRSELIRKILEKYLQHNTSQESDDVFGLWKNKKINALQYEDKIRSEWK